MLAGTRRVPITVVFHLYEDVPVAWEDGGRFYVEKNHCIDNYVAEMAKEIETGMNHCQTCNRAEAYLGHLPFDAVRKVQEALPNEGFTPAGPEPSADSGNASKGDE